MKQKDFSRKNMKDAQTKQKSKQIAFYKDGTVLYDLVANNEGQYFVAYDEISERHQKVKLITLDEQQYEPPKNDLVASNVICLAEYPQEYGNIPDLYAAIKRHIYKYVDIPDKYLTVSTLYVMLTWIYDCFDVIPYLRVVGDFGTGKSRFLLVVGKLAYKACFAGGATSTSPIFRINEIYQGVTLVFDEADFRFSGADADIIKILNCGYMRGMPVLRTEGDGNNRTPKGFDVYGPKIIATREQFQDAALESRCLSQVMAGRPRADIPRHLPKSFEVESLELRNKLLMFRLRNYSKVEIDPSLEMNNLDARINQVALPILSIIKDQSVREEVRQALTDMQSNLNELKKEQEPALILRALIEMIKEDEQYFSYKDVAKKINKLCGIDSDYSYQISPTKIGRINKSVLALEVHQVNGSSKFKTTATNIHQVQSLAQRYGIDEVDDVDLVALYFRSDETVLDVSIPEEQGKIPF